MKPLYWTRIQIKTPATSLVPQTEDPKFSIERTNDKEHQTEAKLWEKLDEVSVPNFDDFAQLFSKQVVEKKEDSEKSDEIKKLKPKQQAVSVLDNKRAQNLGILIKSNKLENISTLKHAIFELDLGE